MSELIKVNYTYEQQTASARALWEFLDRPWGEFPKWFNHFKEYGFTEGQDYKVSEYLFENPLGGRPSTDYEISIDMAKELAMLQKTDKGKQARQYFLELEKKWNSPEALMARALKMADMQLIALQGTVTTLQTENKLLTQQTLTWANRKLIEALVKKYGSKVGYDVAWREFKKELLYKYSININSRLTNKINSTGKKNIKTLDMIHDDELADCVSTAVAICKNSGVSIADILKKHEEAV